MVERLREKRLLEERLHFAERSTALGRLASAVAHEIRNPLNFINLSIDHVRERAGPGRARARARTSTRILGNMKSEISRLNRLVGDFLSFGKPMRLDPRPCALDEVLREVASLVDHKARDQGIALAVEAEPEPAPDRRRSRAAQDLLPEPHDQRRRRHARGRRCSTVGVRARDGETGGTQIEVERADTGHGMTRGGDPRAPSSPTSRPRTPGLGLGLALTHKIVERPRRHRSRSRARPAQGPRPASGCPCGGRGRPPARGPRGGRAALR